MKNITVSELKEKLDNGEQFILIDCREPAENQEYNIGGNLIPLGKIQRMELGDLENRKNEEVVVYCRSGQRSAMACMYLEMMGFKNTNNLAGGVIAWIKENA